MIKKITPKYKNRLLFMVTLFLSSQLFSQTSPTTFDASGIFTVPVDLTQITASPQNIQQIILILYSSETQFLQVKDVSIDLSCSAIFKHNNLIFD